MLKMEKIEIVRQKYIEFKCILFFFTFMEITEMEINMIYNKSRNCMYFMCFFNMSYTLSRMLNFLPTKTI